MILKMEEVERKSTLKQPFVVVAGASTSDEVVAVKELKDPIHATNLLLQILVFLC